MERRGETDAAANNLSRARGVPAGDMGEDSSGEDDEAEEEEELESALGREDWELGVWWERMKSWSDLPLAGVAG